MIRMELSINGGEWFGVTETTACFAAGFDTNVWPLPLGQVVERTADVHYRVKRVG